MKLYVKQFTDNKNPFGELYGLCTEDGELLYSHICTNKGFAYNDLYLRRPERIEELEKRFGAVELIRD